MFLGWASRKFKFGPFAMGFAPRLGQNRYLCSGPLARKGRPLARNIGRARPRAEHPGTPGPGPGTPSLPPTRKTHKIYTTIMIPAMRPTGMPNASASFYRYISSLVSGKLIIPLQWPQSSGAAAKKGNLKLTSDTGPMTICRPRAAGWLFTSCRPKGLTKEGPGPARVSGVE